MSIGIACLLADSGDEAMRLARELDSFNRERRSIEKEMKDQAQELLASMALNPDELPWGLVLCDPDWHQGVIGILAARIREQTHRPTIAFAGDEAGDELKGLGPVHTGPAYPGCAGGSGFTLSGDNEKIRWSCHGGRNDHCPRGSGPVFGCFR